MLATETYSVDDALDELDDRIGDIDATLDDLDESTDQYQKSQSRRDRLRYLQNGLRWQRDEAEWGDAEIELGALTAGEKALMHREATDGADREEMRLWFVAASTAAAPYAADDLSDTFNALAGCHPAFVQWAEAKANGLGVPGGESGNRSSTSSPATETSETSTDAPDSITTSSSDSPTG